MADRTSTKGKIGDTRTKIRLLLADDHPVFREGLCRLLEDESDMDCIAVAKDGEEAVKQAKECNPDVALIDIEMPKIDGIEVARQIKQTNPDIAVLILSAYKDDKYILASMESGVSGYLLKNVNRSDLINAIRVVYGGEGVFDRQVTSKVYSILSTSKDSAEEPDKLHPRELEVLGLAAQGMSNKGIAHILGISAQTVGTHFVNIFRKLQVGSRTEAILYALKKRWIAID